MLEKTPFRKYDLEEDRNKPISVKLNEKDEEMLSIGMYALNMHSKGGVLKELAELGLKVLLEHFGVEKMHYLTRSDRIKVVQEKPVFKHFTEKGN